jgi:hypothetical protein
MAEGASSLFEAEKGYIRQLVLGPMQFDDVHLTSLYAGVLAGRAHLLLQPAHKPGWWRAEYLVEALNLLAPLARQKAAPYKVPSGRIHFFNYRSLTHIISAVLHQGIHLSLWGMTLRTDKA